MDINNILSKYDIWRAFEMKRMSSWYANINYKITTNEWNYLFRICKYKDYNEIEYEIKILTYLKEKSFLAAFPIINETDYGCVVLYDFIKGNEPSIDISEIKEIANSIWELHLIEYWKDLFKWNYKKTISYCNDTIKKFNKAKYKHFDLFSFYENEMKSFEKILNKKLPFWIIHSDIFPDNTIFLDSKLIAILDFEEVHIWELLLDIWAVINGFCFIKWNKLSYKYLKVFITEYEKVRKLTQNEKNMLFVYIELSTLFFISFKLNFK